MNLLRFILIFLFITTFHISLLKGEDVQNQNEKIDENTTKAKLHFEKGISYYEKKNWDLALEEFTKAFSLKPHWKIRYNIGLCYKQLGLWTQSMTQLTLMLEEGGDEIPLKQAEKVMKVISEMQEKVGFLTLEGNIEKAQVKVDGKLIEEFTKEKGIFLNPGEHRITIVAGEEIADEFDVVIVGGQKKSITVKIDESLFKKKKQPERILVPVPVVQPKTKKYKPPSWNILTGSILAAFAFASLAGGTAAGIYALKQKENRDSIYEDYMKKYNEGRLIPGEWELTKKELDSYYDKSQKSSLACNILLGIGGGLAITSTIIFLSKKIGKKEKKNKNGLAAETKIMWAISPDFYLVLLF